MLFYFIHHEEDDVQLTALTALGEHQPCHVPPAFDTYVYAQCMYIYIL